MASIRKRSGRYHVQIRKNGYQTVTHTLSSLSLARKWAASVEADMERHLYIEVSEAQRTTLLSSFSSEKKLLKHHKGKHLLSHIWLADLTRKLRDRRARAYYIRGAAY